MDDEDRRFPSWTGSERENLVGWLVFQRDTLAWKCDGLTPEQLCERSAPPSSMSLIGLVRHMADVERGWFQRILGGRGLDLAPRIFYSVPDNTDGDFDDVSPATVEADMATWRSECDAADAVLATMDLDETRFMERDQTDVSVRWVVAHMVEEYARHNGHADLLRECLDGATGD